MYFKLSLAKMWGKIVHVSSTHNYTSETNKSYHELTKTRMKVKKRNSLGQDKEM